MADIVMAYSASHAPMMSADKESAPPDQAERFFGGLAKVCQQAADSRPQAIVFMTGEHFTNFFLQNLPQIAIGLGSGHQGPLEKWLNIPKTIIPGDPGLAEHVLEALVADGFYPALSHKMKLDHGFMTVYHELDPEMELPVVPIVLNCTTPPLMTLRQSYEFGKSVGAAIRSYDGLERVGLVGAGGLSHFVGEPRIGDIEEDFDRWFLEELERQPLSDDLLDMPNDELMEAGNGTGEVRAWVAVGGAMEGHTRDHPVLRTHLRMDQRNGCDQLPDLTRPVSSAQSPALVARARAKCATEENCVPFRRQFRFLDSPTRHSNSTLQRGHVVGWSGRVPWPHGSDNDQLPGRRPGRLRGRCQHRAVQPGRHQLRNRPQRRECSTAAGQPGQVRGSGYPGQVSAIRSIPPSHEGGRPAAESRSGTGDPRLGAEQRL